MFKAPDSLSRAMQFAVVDHRLSYFDWQKVGVQKTFLIVFTGRTGSTLLTRMIEKTKLCGVPSEYFSEGFVASQKKFLDGNIDPEAYLTSIASRFSRNGIFGAEIDSLRMLRMEQVIDMASVFPASKTPYIWMTRTDIASQAFSFVSALISGLWHVMDCSKQVGLPAIDPEAEIHDAKIWNHIQRILAEEQSMERFFHQNNITPFNITYEEFIADKVLTVARIAAHIGLELTPEIALKLAGDDPTRRLDYSSKNAFLLGFEARHPEAMRYLRTHRHSINRSELACLIGR